MAKSIKAFSALILFLLFLVTGCMENPRLQKDSPGTGRAAAPGTTQSNASGSGSDGSRKIPGEAENTVKGLDAADIAKIKPNENGKIMVVMFHNFVQSFTPTKHDDGQYTTTFGDFEKLLPQLYEKGYRLISVSDYLNNNISVPAGCIPMVFTFDDGTAGQFNLVEENGKLEINKKSAVGIMEEFNKTHPDFGLAGTFYVNLGLQTFAGKGTLSERLKYLTDRGFEIGNHTYTHIYLNEAKSADAIQKEIGENQKKMYELIPGYRMVSLALPFGQAPKELQGYVAKGEYQGVGYENAAIMEVGWDPALSPVSKNFNPLSIHRVRASGIKPVNADLAWWLKNLPREDQYVSDGNSDTITIPKSKEGDIDKNRLNGKKLVLY
ncbi:MAG: polysaccharide deacetylase family protein [Clostridiales bacterium]|jgi:peptidoglycan/xylan/chitin deacetylase (PgdA/CDA1 family)|nr:polysaccharide deacetylase family protein [Eubacteriales bacterium]MDH7565874.1 polysaccharide deacetylase family protein [Clostridiales bacterium]